MACALNGMAELTVGQRVNVRPKVGPSQEGVVYTHDALTNTITIKQDIPNTKTHTTILVFNRAHVEIDVVPGASVVDNCMTLPNIRCEREDAPPCRSPGGEVTCCSPTVPTQMVYAVPPKRCF